MKFVAFTRREVEHAQSQAEIRVLEYLTFRRLAAFFGATTKQVARLLLAPGVQVLECFILPVDLLAVRRDSVRLVVGSGVEKVSLNDATEVLGAMLTARCALDVEEERRCLRSFPVDQDCEALKFGGKDRRRERRPPPELLARGQRDLGELLRCARLSEFQVAELRLV